MRDSVVPPFGPRAESHKSPSPATRFPAHQPQGLSDWLRLRVDRLATGWLSSVLDREHRTDPDATAVVEDFLGLLVSILPGSVGPHSRQLDSIWQRAAELYGSFGVARGLAAGEIVEEFQLLRTELIRLLFSEPPISSGPALLGREVLRLNRFLDLGVTQASVGHTDRLFFDLFQGGSGASQVTPELITEVRHQLTGIEDELREVLGA